MQTTELLINVLNDLNDIKAINVKPLDVRQITSITDYMVIASGTSSRHVHAIADNLIHKMKTRFVLPYSVQGDINDEWIIVDLGDIVVHIMQPTIRAFYNLEKLWTLHNQPQVAMA
ncbi:MAG: ribosome silencing factor [Proteobacteria bacterium]|nr:ribosome silencing factor [Pseudomonadota bacterium]